MGDFPAEHLEALRTTLWREIALHSTPKGLQGPLLYAKFAMLPGEARGCALAVSDLTLAWLCAMDEAALAAQKAREHAQLEVEVPELLAFFRRQFAVVSGDDAFSAELVAPPRGLQGGEGGEKDLLRFGFVARLGHYQFDWKFDCRAAHTMARTSSFLRDQLVLPLAAVARGSLALLTRLEQMEARAAGKPLRIGETVGNAIERPEFARELHRRQLLSGGPRFERLWLLHASTAEGGEDSEADARFTSSKRTLDRPAARNPKKAKIVVPADVAEDAVTEEEQAKQRAIAQALERKKASAAAKQQKKRSRFV